MKTIVAILLIASFLQATIVPIDLVLLLLVCRAFTKADKANLYLAFAFGLFLSLLSISPMGIQSVIFLLVIMGVENISRTRLSQNALAIVPIFFVSTLLNTLIISLFTHSSFTLVPKIWGVLLSLPIFYLIRFWEERFIVRKEIRLKINHR